VKTQRTLVRVLVGASLCLALTGWIGLPAPEELPAIALGQASLYRLEVALITFYGCLLILTPAYSGLAMGRLPIEISTRGAKFAEEADQWAKVDSSVVKELEERVSDLAQELAEATFEVDQPDEPVSADKRQQELSSDR
jgi:hypothetical protein